MCYITDKVQNGVVKRLVQPKNFNSLIIYSLSFCSKPVSNSFFCGTHNFKENFVDTEKYPFTNFYVYKVYTDHIRQTGAMFVLRTRVEGQIFMNNYLNSMCLPKHIVHKSYGPLL